MFPLDQRQATNFDPKHQFNKLENMQICPKKVVHSNQLKSDQVPVVSLEVNNANTEHVGTGSSQKTPHRDKKLTNVCVFLGKLTFTTLHHLHPPPESFHHPPPESVLH